MKIREFQSKSLRTTYLAQMAPPQFQLPTPGKLRISEVDLQFNDWKIYFSDISSARLEVLYSMGIPSYVLKVQDAMAGYTFTVPAREVENGFPFPVDTVGIKTFWQRFLTPAALAIVIIVLILKDRI